MQHEQSLHAIIAIELFSDCCLRNLICSCFVSDPLKQIKPILYQLQHVNSFVQMYYLVLVELSDELLN